MSTHAAAGLSRRSAHVERRFERLMSQAPPGGPVERRLAAIMAADVAGYSRLMGVDEECTLHTLKAHLKDVVDPALVSHRGRIVKTTGDGLLVEFASAVDAVRCAVDVQRGMAERNETVPLDRRIEFRIGINVGDIIGDGADIYGDGVNVAARLEAMAAPGGICVSRAVRDPVRDKLAFGFDDLGEVLAKNIARPIHVFRVRHDPETDTPAPAASRPQRVGRVLIAVVTTLVVVGATAGMWFVLGRAQAPPSSPLVAVAVTSTEKPSIAVLPFANLSGDPTQEYFSDGVSEEILTALARSPYLTVIARNSSFTFKNKAVNVIEAGKTLGVRYDTCWKAACNAPPTKFG
jgi:class 3 adenylate cyclase